MINCLHTIQCLCDSYDASFKSVPVCYFKLESTRKKLELHDTTKDYFSIVPGQSDAMGIACLDMKLVMNKLI